MRDFRNPRYKVLRDREAVSYTQLTLPTIRLV